MKIVALKNALTQGKDLEAQVQERQAAAQKNVLQQQKEARLGQLMSGATVDPATGLPDMSSPSMQQVLKEFPEVHSALSEHYAKSASDLAAVKNFNSEATNRETAAERTAKLNAPTGEEKNYQGWLASMKLPDNATSRIQYKVQGQKLSPDEIIAGAPGEHPLAQGTAKPKPLRFTSNVATGGLETIEDPNSGATYHAGNIAAAPPEVKSAWDSVMKQQATQQSYKDTEQGKRDAALMERQNQSFQNAIAKSQFDNAQKIVTSANTDYQSALDRVKTMERNRASALKNGDQQGMLSLLTNHIGMTLGAQKGARITQAILQEAQSSMPLLEKIESKFDSRGFLSGVTLGPEQMQFMVDLAHERANDMLEHKQRVETDYHDALNVGGRKPAAAKNDPLGIR